MSSVCPQSLASGSEYIFLDSACFSEKPSQSFLFTRPRKYVSAFNVEEVVQAVDEIQCLSQKYWLAGYIRYEAVSAFLPKRHPVRHKSLSYPLLWFGVYDHPKIVHEVCDDDAYPSSVVCQPKISYRQYRQVISDIKQQIKSGNTYQVNYTFDVLVKAGCSPEFLYFLLRRQQKTPYCAVIKNDYEQILSFSPELFFQREGEKIWTKPMKGTLARADTDENDEKARQQLRDDLKNRAENLMIVDLLRNDLGRICKTGTVGVPSMFDVETHPTVHQMTSLIQGVLKDNVSYRDILQSLFPCGSVTGAPKIKTMQIIDQIEEGRRGVYCGAIGYIAPKDKAVFSVPIRILQRNHDEKDWTYRVGSGIVWDSSAKGEWEESRIKTRFLTAQKVPEFELLETVLWDGNVFAFEKEHFQRLKRSAISFKFSLNMGLVRKILLDIQKKYGSKKRMIRLMMSRKGAVRYEAVELKMGRQKNVTAVSGRCLDRGNPFLRHKTTYRPWYEETMKKISRGEVWDEIFLNQYGEVCEGARSNVFVEKRGKIFTPPVACGLLPGIFRGDFLKHGQCEEKILLLKDLKSADVIYCGNSVRGLTEVRLL